MNPNKILKFTTNKILYTNHPFRWIKTIQEQKNTIIITPSTKIIDLLTLKASSPIYLAILQKFDEVDNSLINEKKINDIILEINSQFKNDVIDYNFNVDKLIKLLFKINDTNFVNEEFLVQYLNFLNANTSQITTIYLVEFNLNLSEFNMLNIHVLTNSFNNLISWNNLEQLVFLDLDEQLEIIDKEKFLAWLELTTKTVLSYKDIDDFFKNEMTFHAFLISKAIRQI